MNSNPNLPPASILNVIAIDDEPLALRQLVSYIQRVPFLHLLASCHSAVEARELLSHATVDAIFCDINMPDLSGLDFVRQLSPAPLVVFTTAYSEYAIEGFRVDAVDYLLKPFTYNEFLVSAERLRQRHDLLRSAPAEEATFYVRADHRTVGIRVSDIIHVQAMGEYLRIFLESQPRPIMTLMTTKYMESILPADRFMRIHRSHIINLAHVSQVSRTRVHLSDGTELPIGDNYRQEFEQWLNERKVK